MATQGILRPGTGKRNAIHQTRNLADRPGSARRGKADPPSGASAGVSGQMDRHPLRRPRTGMTFGVLLPHFGPHASRTRLIEGIKLIEDLGFDAVWARDHLLWHPHSHEEHTDMTFLEPFTTLIGLGTLVERLVIGTGVMIPVRHPIRVAQQYMTLSYLTGGRVIAGFGAGHGGELRAAGIDPDRKHQAVLEMIEIVRRLWAGNGVTFEGEIFRIHHASLEPKLQHPLPILYGGPSRRAARIAACHADGWLAGTVPLTTVDARLSYMRELLGSIDHLFLSVTPRTILDEDREREILSAVLTSMEETIGRPTKGWLSPFLTHTDNTPRLLEEFGVEYLCDYTADDHPFRFNTPKNNLIAVPYTVELNDIPAFGNVGVSSEAFGDMIIDQFDVLYEEGATNARCMPICLHTFWVGQPNKFKHLARAFRYMARHEGVWFTTGDDVNDWYRANFM